MIYLFLLALALLLLLLYGGKRSNAKRPYYIYCGLLVAVAAARFRVGGDSLAYQDTFSNLPNLQGLLTFHFREAEFNPLWYVFNAIIKSIHNDFTFFQLVHALVVNIIVFRFIAHYALNKYWIMPFYLVLNYVYFNMEILREVLAICTFLLSVGHLLKKDWKRYYLLCIVAYLFHTSAFILFLFPLVNRRYKLWQQAVMVGVVFLMSTPVTISFLEQNVFPLLGASAKAASYLSVQVSETGFFYQLLKILPVFITFYIRKKTLRRQHVFSSLVFPYLLLGVLSSQYAGAYRFLNYLSIPMLVYVIDTLYELFIFRKYVPFYYVGVRAGVLLMVLLQLQYLTRDTSYYAADSRYYNRYYPYRNVLNPQVESKREALYYNFMNL